MLQSLATYVITRFNESNMSDLQADDLAQPLLKELKRQKIITEIAHIEWSGVREFELIPIFWFDLHDQQHCLNLYADGSYQVFA